MVPYTAEEDGRILRMKLCLAICGAIHGASQEFTKLGDLSNSGDFFTQNANFAQKFIIMLLITTKMLGN